MNGGKESQQADSHLTNKYDVDDAKKNATHL